MLHIKKVVVVLTNIKSSQDSLFLQSFVWNRFYNLSLRASIKKDQNIMYDKQYGFQTVHSTNHTIAQLLDQI